MLDFKELPKDGVKFEQLIREIFVKEGYEVHWTGVGPDNRKDLVIVEKLQGPLSYYKRRWLVSCKHKAHSGKAVSVSDLTDISGDCAQVKAEGFILATSTYPSSSVVNRLDDTASHNALKCLIWDEIEIERRLLHPTTFPLINTFFPESSKNYKWSIYNGNSPNVWAANYKSYFLYLSSRVSNSFPFLAGVEDIIEIIEEVKMYKPREGYWWESHYLRPRAIYYDDKYSTHYVYLDYIYPSGKKVKALNVVQLNDQLISIFGKYSKGRINEPVWDVSFIETSIHSDSFDWDSKEYYLPFMKNFLSGSARSEFLTDKVYAYNFYLNLRDHKKPKV